MDCTRRKALGLIGSGAVAGLAGCIGGDPKDVEVVNNDMESHDIIIDVEGTDFIEKTTLGSGESETFEGVIPDPDSNYTPTAHLTLDREVEFSKEFNTNISRMGYVFEITDEPALEVSEMDPD